MILLNIFTGGGIISPFYKWELSGYEAWDNLPKSTHLVTEKLWLEPKAEGFYSRCSLHHSMLFNVTQVNGG